MQKSNTFLKNIILLQVTTKDTSFHRCKGQWSDKEVSLQPTLRVVSWEQIIAACLVGSPWYYLF